LLVVAEAQAVMLNGVHLAVVVLVVYLLQQILL